MNAETTASPAGAGRDAGALDILLISEHNYPSQSSGGRLLQQLCSDLVGLGNRVSAISSAGQYTTDRGILLEPRETHDGVEYERFAPTRLDRRSLLKRSINEVTYSLRVGVRLLGRRRPDVLLVLSSPPFMLPVIAFVARLRKIPMVPVVMDVFPDMATVTGHLSRSSLIFRVWDAVQRASLRSAARVVVLGRCMRDVVARKSPGVPIDVIPNWADDDLRPMNRADNRFLEAHPRLRSSLVVMYSGNLGQFHDFETLLSAAEALRERPDVRFAVIGDGARRSWIEKQIAERRLDNVDLMPFQPAELLPHSLNAADIALVTLEQGAEGLCVPSKFYPLLAVGRPVVAVMGHEAEVARVVEGVRCGRVVEPGDAAGLAAAIEALADDPIEREAAGARGRAAFLRTFARRFAAPRYLATLQRSVSESHPAADVLRASEPR